MNHEKFDKMKQNKSTKIDEIIRKIHCKKFTKVCKYFSRKILKFGLLAKDRSSR